MKISRKGPAVLLALLFAMLIPQRVMASDGETGLVTITVSASDNSGQPLQYALDTDDPSAFGPTNYFSVAPGSTHTVYVRDAAGNISGQKVEAPAAAQEDTISVTIGESTESDSYPYSTDIYGDNYSNFVTNPIDAAEPGGGQVDEYTQTDGSEDSEKVFYTITTKAGNVFYMVVDKGRSDNNVYLLDQVTERDLTAMAEAAEAEGKDAGTEAASATDEDQEKLDKILQQLEDEKASESESTDQQPDSKAAAAKSDNSIFFVLILTAIFGGVFYYIKVYKPKAKMKLEDEDLEDAMDLDAFENPDDDETITFPETDLKDIDAQAQIRPSAEAMYEYEEPEYEPDPDEYEEMEEVEEDEV